MIKTTGKLVYDPIRFDFKKTHKQRTLILDLKRDDLDLYYQWFLKQKYGQWMSLQRPMYGVHCTVIKGDEFIPKDKLCLWKKYQGQFLEIEYDPSKIERHWEFWSLSVKSKQLIEIRKELGLKEDFRLHITIGRQYSWMPKINL